MTWLTTAEAATHLKRDPDRIRLMAERGEIPAHRHKDGAHWRFDTDELDAWVRGETPARRSITTRGRKSA